MSLRWIATAAFMGLLATGAAATAATDRVAGDTLSPFSAPLSLSSDHREIHERLTGAALEPGRIGAAARTLAELLAPHTAKEEAYALPPLALLPALARGESYEEMREILWVTDRLAMELPAMLDEHRAITAAAEELRAAARLAGRADVAQLAEQVIRHAQTEERITYPTALLVGTIVESRFGRTAWYPDSR